MKSLVYPFSEDAVRALKAGDAVSISGRLYTGRDKFHKFFADGGALPVDFRDGALYHCGPVCVQGTENSEQRTENSEQRTVNSEQRTDVVVVEPCSGCSDEPKVENSTSVHRSLFTVHWQVVAAGPTTSVRENPYEPAFIAASGVRLVIGKGGMDAATLAAMEKHGCVYIQAVGGAGALYAAAVKRVAGVSLLEEFGAAEAVWHFDVEDFRGIVAMDSHGRSLFDEVETRSEAALKSLTSRKSLSTPEGRGNPGSPEPPRQGGATASATIRNQEETI